MPTQQIYWRCDLCGEEYPTPEEAQQCENAGAPRKPQELEIGKYYHNDGYPRCTAKLVAVYLENPDGVIGNHQWVGLFDKRMKDAIYGNPMEHKLGRLMEASGPTNPVKPAPIGTRRRRM